jgi:ribonuclease Z
MMTLTVLGNGAGGPFQGRSYTAQVLRVDQSIFLVDCGEGTQMQLYHHRVRYDGLSHIFISHLHGDHVFGLTGLLTSFCLKQRTAPLHLFGPPGLQELVETTSRLCGVRYPYPLFFHTVDPFVHQKVLDLPKVEVYTIPLLHRTPCTGWLFREKPRPLNMRPDQIEALHIPYQDIPAIKAGADWTAPGGVLVPNAELTLPPAPPRSYAFCSDTAFYEPVIDCVRGVSLLYHEATFTNEHQEEARVSNHSTAAEAATIAQKAGVQRLILGHFSARYKDIEQHLMEARAIFGDTVAAVEGEVVEV